MGQIQLNGVTKVFSGAKQNAVDEVSLEISDGEFLVLVGPSGCGKSTLLRMIAGIETVSSGQILIDGVDATHALPKHRDIAMVFQSYALYPHMSVAENLHFALKLRKMPKAEREQRVGEVMRMLRLGDLERRKPGQLSGGQRQRVAMGRAMVREPSAFLMDEPLSNLDAKLRVAMRSELARLHDRLATTTIYVTHDQTEAMTLGQRVAVLKDGVLQQVDTPTGLFHRPRNLFVAAFIGSPAINLVNAKVAENSLHFGGHSLPIPAHAELGDRSEVILGVRPSDFELVEFAALSSPRISARLEVVRTWGPRCTRSSRSRHLGSMPTRPEMSASPARETPSSWPTRERSSRPLSPPAALLSPGRRSNWRWISVGFTFSTRRVDWRWAPGGQSRLRGPSAANCMRAGERTY